MKTTTVIEELEQAARQLGFAVRKEKGNFRGGVCTVDGDAIIMLNKRQIPDVQLVVLADSLRDAPIETVYLKPAVRDALEDAWAQLDRAEEATLEEETPEDNFGDAPGGVSREPSGTEATNGAASADEAVLRNGSRSTNGAVSEHGPESENGSRSGAEHTEDVEAPVSHAR